MPWKFRGGYAPQMMDGLALAETTPGPLILVLQFVGFMGGWNEPGSCPPAWMALAGSIVTCWMTFVPGFLFIFIGAPYIEFTRGLKRLSTVMTAISAAGVRSDLKSLDLVRHSYRDSRTGYIRFYSVDSRNRPAHRNPTLEIRRPDGGGHRSGDRMDSFRLRTECILNLTQSLVDTLPARLGQTWLQHETLIRL